VKDRESVAKHKIEESANRNRKREEKKKKEEGGQRRAYHGCQENQNSH
jgi:hypothetical protein